MEYGLKKDILNMSKTSYANDKQLPKDISDYIDCSNGINPLGVSEQVKDHLANIPLSVINTYAKSSLDLREAIVEYWRDTSKLNSDQVLLGGGSMEIIYKINKLFIENKSKVLGYSPQFSDYIDDINSYGGRYDSYCMSVENNYKFISNEFISKIKKYYKMVYIDNPNNPTGQVIGIDCIEKIVKEAKNLKLPVIIDEAYGDFIDKKNSAISLMERYDNLLVIRTFSKGLGLAGVRAGYLITSNTIAENYLKISNPFEMNSVARYLAMIVLQDKQFMIDCNNILTAYKKKFIHSLSKLAVLETSYSVPIMVIMHPDSSVDMEELLLKHDILSISGKGFIGLGKNSARLIINKEIDSLIKIFKKIESEI